MPINHERYKAWYIDVLTRLFPDRDAGFVILMATFPLLERYLRNKVGLTSKDNLTDDFMDALQTLFPELPNRETARDFWQVYRHGLLHEVTLSRENRRSKAMPVGWLSHDKPIVSIESDGSFWLHPVLFAERVLTTIDGDFTTFDGTSANGSSFPTVEGRVESSKSSGVLNPYLGTRAGP